MAQSDAVIVRRALEMLAAGVLASVLPERLMSEFDIGPDRARRLAQQALKRRKREQGR